MIRENQAGENRPRLTHLLFSLVVVSIVMSSATHAQRMDPDDPLKHMRWKAAAKMWDETSQELAKAEKGGHCRGAICLVTQAMLANGSGNSDTARKYALQVVSLFDQEPGLNSVEYNEAGVILYRTAAGDKAVLEHAESAFRQAQALYTKAGSNIRYNLATVLETLGRGKEAAQLKAELESGGILLEPGMSILADFQGPERQQPERQDP